MAILQLWAQKGVSSNLMRSPTVFCIDWESSSILIMSLGTRLDLILRQQQTAASDYFHMKYYKQFQKISWQTLIFVGACKQVLLVSGKLLKTPTSYLFACVSYLANIFSFVIAIFLRITYSLINKTWRYFIMQSDWLIYQTFHLQWGGLILRDFLSIKKI